MRFKVSDTVFEASFLTIALMASVLVMDVSGKVFMCYLSAILHECGHLFAMRCFGVVPKSIRLRLFDIVIDAKADDCFWHDIIITASGPFANLIFSLVFFYLYKPLMYINLLIAVFNLLPIESFDGGHILSVILSLRLSSDCVRIIIRILTLVLLVPVFLSGLFVLLYSKYNYSLLLISLYLFAILFLK